MDPKENELHLELSTSPTNLISITYERTFTELFFSQWREKRFTGFSVKWEYKNTQQDSSKRLGMEFNNVFKKLVSLVHRVSSSLSEEDIMKVVKKIKSNKDNFFLC